MHAGEAPTALLLTINVFLLLTAYYLLKVAREPLILVGGGAEVKSYASVGQSFLLIGVTSAYSWLASHVGRMALTAYVTLFFIACLLAFWLLGVRGVPLGVPFFLWVGIFNVTSVAQFWSFAADVYTDERGKRLFPIIGIGSSVGAVAGAWIADFLLRLGPFGLMPVAAGFLVVCLGLTYVVHRRESVTPQHQEIHEAPLKGKPGFALVFTDRYLILFAAMIFVLNVVTKTGDYVFDRKLLAAAHDAALATGIKPTAFIGQFKASYFEWVNGAGVVIQMFLVSRIIKYIGMRGALLVMPIVSLVGYGTTFMIPLTRSSFLGAHRRKRPRLLTLQLHSRSPLARHRERREIPANKSSTRSLVRAGDRDVRRSRMVWRAHGHCSRARSLASMWGFRALGSSSPFCSAAPICGPSARTR